VIVAVLTRKSPLVLGSGQVLISIGIVAYLIKMKPFVRKLNRVQLLTFETITLMLNACILSLIVLSENNRGDTPFAVILGDFVIIGNVLLNFLNLGFLVVRLYVDVCIVHHYIKKQGLRGKDTIGLWLQLLYIPMQQSNMGFEEVIAYPMVNHLSVKKIEIGSSLEQNTINFSESQVRISFEYNY